MYLPINKVVYTLLLLCTYLFVCLWIYEHILDSFVQELHNPRLVRELLTVLIAAIIGSIPASCIAKIWEKQL